jgi:hypothetical protein
MLILINKEIIMRNIKNIKVRFYSKEYEDLECFHKLYLNFMHCKSYPSREIQSEGCTKFIGSVNYLIVN